MSKDYYEILGVSDDASPDEIKRVFRRLAKQYHPDANPGNSAAVDKFKDIGEAYDIIGDEEKRNRYNDMRKAGVSSIRPEDFEDFFKQADGDTQQKQPPKTKAQPRPGQTPPGKAATAGDVKHKGKEFLNELGDEIGGIFSNMFKKDGNNPQAGPKPQPQTQPRPEPLTRDIEITFEEAVHGTRKRFSFKLMNPCGGCRGLGSKGGTANKQCALCQGRGNVPEGQGNFTVSKQCPHCIGRGHVVTDPCTLCEGSGFSRYEHKMLVNIPEGVKEGEKLRVTTTIPDRNNNQPTEMFLVVHVLDSEDFRREGNDVHSTVTINLPKAMMGGKVKVQTIDGARGARIPPGTKSGAKLRLKELGLKQPNGTRGDHYVEIQVEIPEATTPAQIEALKKFAQEFDLNVEGN
ncbi:MAG: DnaJ domain-containing protein [Planctomycetota bacterium]|nr:DnaJ domain-containing protein [Planctomycetota bacterium]MDA1142207.1 DnaJ domain-containing protein [Planctomycetota bacterium]